MTTARKTKEKPAAAATTTPAPETATIEAQAAPPAPRTKRVRINRTETFVEPVLEPEPHTTLDEGETETDAGDDDFEFEGEPVSDVDILLGEAENDAQFTMVVEKLPNFEKDGRADTRAEREYCTTFTPPTLDYLERVKGQYGHGHYLFAIYERGRGCRRRWAKHISKPLRDETPAVAAASSQPLAPGTHAPDSLETFTRQAGQLAVVMQALGYERPTPAQTAATATPPAPVDPTDQFMTNLEKYMTLTERLSPVREANGGASRSIIGDIAELIREAGTHGKALAPLLATMIAPPAIQAPPPPPPQPTPLRDATAATTPVPPPPAPPTPVNPFEPTLKIILEDLTANAPHRRAIDAIDDLYASNPELEETLDALWDLPASELVGAFAQMTGAHYLLSAEWMPHSLRWTDELQKVFNHDDAEDSAVPAADADSSTDAVQATG